jgi:hypothetical protein
MMPVKIREGAMAMLEVKSVPNLLGTPVSYAYAVKAGPWIFLTGHEAFDFESGIPGEVAGPSGFPLFGRAAQPTRGRFHFAANAAHSARVRLRPRQRRPP